MVVIGFSACADNEQARHQAGIRLRDELLALIGIPSPTVAVTEKGRPFLPGGEADFSISHSGTAVMVGVCTRGRAIPADLPQGVLTFPMEAERIGVDIERIDESAGKRCRRVAERYFSAAEQELLASAGTEKDICRLFFRMWTQKESMVKWTGNGLAELSLTDTEHPPEGRRAFGGETKIGEQEFCFGWCI